MNKKKPLSYIHDLAKKRERSKLSSKTGGEPKARGPNMTCSPPGSEPPVYLAQGPPPALGSFHWHSSPPPPLHGAGAHTVYYLGLLRLSCVDWECRECISSQSGQISEVFWFFCFSLVCDHRPNPKKVSHTCSKTNSRDFTAGCCYFVFSFGFVCCCS